MNKAENQTWLNKSILNQQRPEFNCSKVTTDIYLVGVTLISTGWVSTAQVSAQVSSTRLSEGGS